MGLGKSLVLTHPARLGDSVMALPLQRAIAQRGELDSNVGNPYRFLYDLAGISCGSAGPLYPKGARALIAEAKSLRHSGYDTVFLVRPNFRSALLTYLARIPVRIGDNTEGRGPLLTHRAKVAPKSNQLERLAAFGAAVGIDVPLQFGLPASPRLEPPTIGIVPGASYSDKFIPTGSLRTVCERLLQTGHKLVLLGGPGEEAFADPYTDLEMENWIGKFTISDLIAPLSSLSGLVAADGGLYHLAVGCGVPSVGVYGPTVKRYWWHAWGPHRPVLAKGGDTSRVTADEIWQAAEECFSASARQRADHSQMAVEGRSPALSKSH